MNEDDFRKFLQDLMENKMTPQMPKRDKGTRSHVIFAPVGVDVSHFIEQLVDMATDPDERMGKKLSNIDWSRTKYYPSERRWEPTPRPDGLTTVTTSSLIGLHPDDKGSDSCVGDIHDWVLSQDQRTPDLWHFWSLCQRGHEAAHIPISGCSYAMAIASVGAMIDYASGLLSLDQFMEILSPKGPVAEPEVRSAARRKE